MPLEFNPQFQEALQILHESQDHIFLTGRAGTGKSTLLDYFRRHTKKKNAVLASTGVAAVNIEGETIHSFFKFKPGITLKGAKDTAKKYRKTLLYQKLETIIIDEISMVRADLLDCVDTFLQTVRSNHELFGGIQMIMIGDLYQLPPVVTGDEKEALLIQYKTPYFFDARVMQRLLMGVSKSQLKFVELQKIYRQHDQEFIDLLNSIRNKTITDEQLLKLNERHVEIEEESIHEYIYLTSTNRQADTINARNLERLPSTLHQFDGQIEGKFEEKYLPRAMNLHLKKHARVMLLNNDSGGRWINGTLGTVHEIHEHEILVKIDQGGFVVVQPFTWSIYRSQYNESMGEIEKEEVGRFTQFPLKLAWAITIHKSQGKTFDKVIIDLGSGTFSHGQAYVALSRCSSFEGMILRTPLFRRHILMDPLVVDFLSQLERRLAEKSHQLSLLG